MLIVVSPAKNLDYETAPATMVHSMPDMLDDSAELIQGLKKLAVHDVAGLMKLSDKLAFLNYERFQNWSLPFDESNAKQAVLAFNGDVYTGLDANSFAKKDFNFAQKHFRILSGLYGILRPLDLMQPYRLEMGTKFENTRGKDLYAFWGEKITQAINEHMADIKSDLLINLASNEYFKSVKPKLLNAQVIEPQFKDWKNGQFKMISFFAKKARGMMARYIIQNQIKDAEGLKGFDDDGYEYNEALSIEKKPVFTRKQS